MTNRVVEDIQHAIAVAVIIVNISIVGDEPGRRKCFYRIRDTIVVTIEIAEVIDTIAIGIHWRNASVGSKRNSIGVNLSSWSCRVVVDTITIDVHDRGIGAAFHQVADSIVVTVEIAMVRNIVAVNVRLPKRLGHVTKTVNSMQIFAAAGADQFRGSANLNGRDGTRVGKANERLNVLSNGDVSDRIPESVLDQNSARIAGTNAQT